MSDYDYQMSKLVKNIHCVGIGGSGMSGIAEVLLSLGYFVSGSDLVKTKTTERLAQLGVVFSNNHAKENIKEADVVVYSSAVEETNIEIKEAKALRIPTISRAQMLAEIMRFRYGIAVAGSHGKTTTTSLIATILADSGQDPTFIIGGVIKGAASNARLGAGRYLVAEADESDGSFLMLHPLLAVLTNIDADHLENYNEDFELLKEAFLKFLRRLPFYGSAYICSDDENNLSLIDNVSANVVTYGLHKGADFRAINLVHENGNEIFDLQLPDKNVIESVKVKLSGVHNVQNTLASIAVSNNLGVPLPKILSSLKNFSGIDRRCQVYDNILLANKKITLLDDYGHHPKEIQAILDTISRRWSGRRLLLLFQPHRYSRTNNLFDQFVSVLSKVDKLFLLNIYSAGEKNLKGVTSENLAKAVRDRSDTEVKVVKSQNLTLENIVGSLVSENDLVLVMGAGSIGKIVENFMAKKHE